MNNSPRLTTTARVPVADNQNFLSAVPRGPLLAQDWQLLEKLAHQNRERIPERVVHANPFDLTKVWAHNDYPLHEVGILEFNQNPDNILPKSNSLPFPPVT